MPGVLRAAAEHGSRSSSFRRAKSNDAGRACACRAIWSACSNRTPATCSSKIASRRNLEAAQAAGATLLADTEVHDWTADERGVRVRTSAGEIAAAKLIIAAGSWAGSMLGDVPLEIAASAASRCFGSRPIRRGTTSRRAFPCISSSCRPACSTAFPELDGRSVKVAEHTGGATVDDPATVNRDVDPDEQRRIDEFLAAHLPDVSPRVADHAVCLYTMSPDEHFIVDRHPAHANVVFAAGLSGHGFKFTPVLGRALADLALDGSTPLAIDFLSLQRFL